MSRKQVDNIVIDKLVSSGSYARLFRGRARDGKAATVRAVSRQDAEQEKRLLREYKALCDVSHGNLARVVDIKKSPTHIYLVLEDCPLGDLEQLLQSRGGCLDQGVGWPLMARIASGLHALHRVGLPHGDLRPANVLLAGTHALPVPKLAGCCGTKFAGGLKAMTQQAEPFACDLWSLAAMTHETLLGTPPSSGYGSAGYARACARGGFGSRELLRALLDARPAKRHPAGETTQRAPRARHAAASRQPSRGPLLETVPEGDEEWSPCTSSAGPAPPLRSMPRPTALSPFLTTVVLPPALRAQAANLAELTELRLRAEFASTLEPAALKALQPRGKVAGEAVARRGSVAWTTLRAVARTFCILGVATLAEKVSPSRSRQAMQALGRAAQRTLNRGPVTSFCIGELRASHLFRLRTARLFPRILFAV